MILAVLDCRLGHWKHFSIPTDLLHAVLYLVYVVETRVIRGVLPGLYPTDFVRYCR